MAYARFGDSDVYVFLSVWGYLDCCNCALLPEDEKRPNGFMSTDEMVAHLKEHQAAGHRVNQETFDRLIADKAENDQWLLKVLHGMCPHCDGAGISSEKECWVCKGKGVTNLTDESEGP